MLGIEFALWYRDLNGVYFSLIVSIAICLIVLIGTLYPNGSRILGEVFFGLGIALIIKTIFSFSIRTNGYIFLSYFLAGFSLLISGAVLRNLH